MKLAQFPDFLDWPDVIRGSTFKVKFGGGPTLDATVTSAAPDSALWKALFTPTPTSSRSGSRTCPGREILTFSAVDVHKTIVGIYQEAATNPKYHGGSKLPDTDDLVKDPDLDDIRQPVRPEPPWVPTDPPTDVPGSASAAAALEGVGLPRLSSRPDPRADPRDLGAGQEVPEMARLPDRAGDAPVPRHRRRHPTVAGRREEVALPSAKKQALDDLRAFVAPTSKDPAKLPESDEVDATFDFHKMIAALGDYPELLRTMGLVVDLTVTVPAGGLPASGTVRIEPTSPLTLATTNYRPKTRYEMAADRFVARPRKAGADFAHGLLRLQDAARFAVHQVDVAGERHQAPERGDQHRRAQGPRRAAGQRAGRAGPAGTPDRRHRGRSSGHPLAPDRDLPPDARDQPPPDRRGRLAVRAARVRRARAAKDRRAVRRGRRARVPRRHPRHQGDGLAVALPACRAPMPSSTSGKTITVEDEGFVQAGVTEPLEPGATRVLRAHETLFTWDGWSLAAPRPGEAILPETGPPDADHPDGVTMHDEVPNTAATSFRLEATFKAKQGTLPRLRYGNRYRVRARVVDLAGNSVFEPDDPAFQQDQPEVTSEFEFRRFEPVGTPPVLLKDVPKEGESLELLTVRSGAFDSEASIRAQATERHLAPPKASQLLAERHGHFDAGQVMQGNAAGYKLASLEADSPTHVLKAGSNEFELVGGVKPVETAAVKRTFWLQEQDTFVVSYLPDPFARGVLLRDLPGMADVDDVKDNVNRLPFDGPWPELQPLRLRLTGLPKGEESVPPLWDPAKRVLTVGLAQGETRKVLLASYFHQADLETDGCLGLDGPEGTAGTSPSSNRGGRGAQLAPPAVPDADPGPPGPAAARDPRGHSVRRPPNETSAIRRPDQRDPRH